MRTHLRNALERSLRLDDNNATGSPAEPVPPGFWTAVEETIEREKQLGLAEGWQKEFFPLVMPATWTPLDRMSFTERWRRRDGLMVVISAAVEQDDKRWIHVSCSRPSQLPSWAELREVKRLFIGPTRSAIQLLPAEANYVNLHPWVLHMFSCVESDGIPDFTHGTGRI